MKLTNTQAVVILCYGGPAAVIMICSLMAGATIGADFRDDTMIRIGVFSTCNLLLWTLYLAVVMPVASGISAIIVRARTGTQQPAIQLEIAIKSEGQEDTQALPSLPQNYAHRVAAYQQELTEQKSQLVAEILQYVAYIMPPFIHEHDMPGLIEEVRQWSSNPKHTPSRSFDLKERLSTNDLRHFVWNIGERLGQRNGYDGETRCRFVKALFAEALRDVEPTSLKNFRTTAYSDRIKLDIPDAGEVTFHYRHD
jgi:hypothetical protein